MGKPKPRGRPHKSTSERPSIVTNKKPHLKDLIQKNMDENELV